MPRYNHGFFEDAPEKSVEELEQWCEERGLRLSRGLQVKDGQGGWGIFATRDYELGQILCQIPKDALISVRTSSLPPLLPDNHLGVGSSHTILYLSLCLLHELRLGTSSPFWGYLQSLPRETILLPVFWTIADLAGEDGRLAREMIVGTEAERDIFRKDSEGLGIDDVHRFYQTLAPHLPPTPLHSSPSPFLSYLYAYSLVCTRAFLIDLYHTVAMCPFADLLNHSSSSAHTSLSADDFVCHKCGSLRECEHDIQSTSGIVRRLEHLSDKERKRLSAEPDTVDLRVDKRKIRQGDEVYNSYGDNMGDGRLLTEWGFIEEDSTGGIMTFSLEELETGTQQWMEMVQRGEMEWVDRLPVDDEEQLVAPPPDERPLGLTIDTDGVMSVHVFAIILLGRSTTHTSDTVRRGVEELRSAWTASEDETFDEPIEMSRSTFDAVEQVYTLLGKRLASLNRSSLPMEDLYDLRDRLSDKEPLQKMALSVLINERRLLETTREKWADLQACIVSSSESGQGM